MRLSLSLTLRERQGIPILALTGQFTSPDGSTLVRGRIQQLLAGAQSRIILDLSEITEIDSGGLGTLVEAQVSFRRRGGGLKLINLTAKITKPFELTRLITFFEIYPSEEEALASFLPA